MNEVTMDEQDRKLMFKKTFDTVAEGYDNSALSMVHGVIHGVTSTP